MAASEDEIVWLMMLLVGSLALEFAVLIPWHRASTAVLRSLKEKRDATEGEVWRQMEPLNRLYDWDMTTALIQKTVPQLKFDKYFTERRLRDLRMRLAVTETVKRSIRPTQLNDRAPEYIVGDRLVFVS